MGRDKKIEKLTFERGFGVSRETADPKDWAEEFIKEFGLGEYNKQKMAEWFKAAIKSGYNDAFHHYAERD